MLVHALLEELDFADPRPPEPARIATAACELGIELTGEAVVEIATLAGAIADSPLCARLAAAGRLEREQAFAFALDGELLRGLIDVSAVEQDGTLLIVDYKTDRIEGGETSSRGSSTITRSSAWSTRSPVCAAARGASRSPTAFCAHRPNRSAPSSTPTSWPRSRTSCARESSHCRPDVSG